MLQAEEGEEWEGKLGWYGTRSSGRLTTEKRRSVLVDWSVLARKQVEERDWVEVLFALGGRTV